MRRAELGVGEHPVEDAAEVYGSLPPQGESLNRVAGHSVVAGMVDCGRDVTAGAKRVPS